MSGGAATSSGSITAPSIATNNRNRNWKNGDRANRNNGNGNAGHRMTCGRCRAGWG
jgi:hypothetical protein